jgi:hypothetical protein
MQFTFTQRVSLGPADAFTLVSSFGYTLPKIDQDMIAVTRLPEGADGPVGKGSRWRERFTGPGWRPVVVDSEFVTFDPPRSLQVRFKTRGVSGMISFDFAPAGANTDLTITMQAATSGLGRVLYPVVRRDLVRREARRLATFKRLAEGGDLSVAGMREAGERRPAERRQS